MKKRDRAAYMREYRAKKRAGKVVPVSLPKVSNDPKEQVKALAEWSKAALVVPLGHPRSGDPLVLPDFAQAFLVDALAARWSLLCCARKNAKSAICAILALGYLVGPLRAQGWRGCVASLSKEKANELRKQAEEIALASRLKGLTFRRSPQPGRIESATGALDVLAADKNAGAASGFDLVLIDELGLFPERSRDLVSSLRSSISARDGRVVALSVRGFSPLLQEMIDAGGKTKTAVHLYAAPEDCDLDDRAAWQSANPGLGSVKSLSYMVEEAERVSFTPSDESDFRAYDLNQGLDPSREMILQVSDLKGCVVSDSGFPDRRGPCVIGLDIGESASGTAAAIIWPQTGRTEFRFAFGDRPALRDRARRDGAPYVEMERRGELVTYPGRIVPVEAFLSDLAADLKGQRVLMLAADFYKESECRGRAGQGRGDVASRI